MVNNCQLCGECCKRYTDAINFDSEDIRRVKERKPRVLEYLAFLCDDFADAFFNPVNGEELRYDCPFLRKGAHGYYCDIYDVRPNICRGFPWGVERDICKVDLKLINIQY